MTESFFVEEKTWFGAPDTHFRGFLEPVAFCVVPVFIRQLKTLY